MEHASEHIQWHNSNVTKGDRHRMNAHRSCVLWLTGLSGSGKSTIAYEVERRLMGMNVRSYVLDGDNLRHGLNRDLGFSAEHRKENIRRTSEVAKLLVEAGFITMLALISPYRSDRDLARSLFSEGEFVEAYVNCPLQVCEQRDPKGLYKKARAGIIPGFTGISAPYEPPLEPEIVILSSQESLNTSVDQIIDYLVSHHYLRTP